MSKLLAKQRWWKKICLPQSQSDASKNYREIIMHTECASVLATTTDTSSSSSASSGTASQSLSCDSASKSSQPDAGKLFPRNMPSIRRSRRRSASGERRDATPGAAPATATATATLEAAKQPQRSAHQSRQSTVTKLTARKPKANCSKHQRSSSAVVKSAVKTKTKPSKQLTLAPYDIALELPAQLSLEQPTPSLAMALHSQQSSLISSDLSSTSTKLSHAHEEHFHSSGISCNGETDDDVEVAMLTGSLSPAQLLRLQQQQQQQRRSSVVAPHLLPLDELRSLNVCRNRSAVWLHNAPDTEQLLESESGSGLLDHCYLNAAAIADDIQLSDIEEQLAKFDGHSKAPPPQQQQHQQGKHCKAAKT